MTKHKNQKDKNALIHRHGKTQTHGHDKTQQWHGKIREPLGMIKHNKNECDKNVNPRT